VANSTVMAVLAAASYIICGLQYPAGPLVAYN